jgi:4-amino-4-deoxy-L-arabinose transferase-like glycosyltransferase
VDDRPFGSCGATTSASSSAGHPLTVFRTSIGTIATLVLVLYFAPLLLDTPLTDPDEGMHAAIAQEMLNRGEMVVPLWRGAPFRDKPILYFWAQAASISVLGENAAAVRLPGLLFALLGIVTTGWLARALIGGTAGWVAAGAYATLAVPFGLAQAPVHDIALVPCINVAILGLCRLAGLTREEPGPAWVNLGSVGLALGLSLLIKGLAVIAIAGVAFGLAVLLLRRLTLTLVLQGAVVLVIALAIAAPWYLAMEARVPGYLQYYFVQRHLLGFATDTQPHGSQPWWYYVPVVLGGSVPWILYCSVRDSDRQVRILMWCWLLGGLVLLSAAGSKLVTYALPLFPPVAILAASAWNRALSSADAAAAAVLTRRARIHAVMFALVSPALPLAASSLERTDPDGMIVLVIAGAGVVWLWLALRVSKQASDWNWPRLAGMTGLTYGLALMVLGPPIARAHSLRDVADLLNQERELPRLQVLGTRPGSLRFYLRPNLRDTLSGEHLRAANLGQALAASHAGDLVVVPRRDAVKIESVAHGQLRERGSTANPVLLERTEAAGEHAAHAPD